MIHHMSRKNIITISIASSVEFKNFLREGFLQLRRKGHCGLPEDGGGGLHFYTINKHKIPHFTRGGGGGPTSGIQH